MLIYISCAREDMPYRNRFQRVLLPVEKDFGFTMWSMQDVAPGKEWKREMAFHLNDASLFVPIISADYLSDDRCDAETSAAFRLAQAGQLKIVSVFVRSVDLELSPFEQTLILPDRRRCITRWRDQDEAWLTVQRGVLGVLKSLQLP